MEVKTFILRRLPLLIYNPQPSKEMNSSHRDPTITSLYFDNPKFKLYTRKVLKEHDAASLRLRWYGKLPEASEIYIERKTISASDNDSEGANEERICLKQKYVNDFIKGEHSLSKATQKMRDGTSSRKDDADKYQSLVHSIQNFIKENDLQPMMRASYTRTAFQIPGDDRIRVSLDTDLVLSREDALSVANPSREPDDWHRTNIDVGSEDPFEVLDEGEVSRFPYALLELKVLDSASNQRGTEWIHELMYSHLVHAAPRFSKFVHGIAVLFEDHVNCLPFWLSEVDKDIRQDPEEAFNKEQEMKKKQLEDEMAVGSFTHTIRDFGGHISSRHMPSHRTNVSDVKRSDLDALPVNARGVGLDGRKEIFERGKAATRPSLEEAPERSRKFTLPPGYLLQSFPGSHNSGRSGRSDRRRNVQLPTGIQKPHQLLMYQSPVQVESKVWFANQRTFLKWMHIAVLLATLSTALYNSIPGRAQFTGWIAIIYTAIAIFAGLWGYGVYIWRCNLIRQRSGKDFDCIVGPIVVCVALAIALTINFTTKVGQLHFHTFSYSKYTY